MTTSFHRIKPHLRAVHADDDPQSDFTEWRRNRPKPFRIDFDDYYSVRARPALDHLRSIWTTASVKGRTEVFDWAAYFRELPGDWYDRIFDACHYSTAGWEAIALGVAQLLTLRHRA
jgi:hypothetical protein